MSSISDQQPQTEDLASKLLHYATQYNVPIVENHHLIEISSTRTKAGGNGILVNAVLLPENTPVLIKSVKHNYNEHNVDEFVREMRIFGEKIKHENIVGMYGVVQLEENVAKVHNLPCRVCLVFEHLRADPCSLFTEHGLRYRHLIDKISALKGIASALNELHNRGYTHGDFADDNIMVETEEHGYAICMKLIDFGSSRLSDKEQHVCTTKSMQFNGPEVRNLSMFDYGPKNEVFAFAVFAVSMLLDDKTRYALEESRQYLKQAFQDKFIPEALYELLVEQCGDPDPDLRPDMTTVVITLQAIEFELTDMQRVEQQQQVDFLKFITASEHFKEIEDMVFNKKFNSAEHECFANLNMVRVYDIVSLLRAQYSAEELQQAESHKNENFHLVQLTQASTLLESRYIRTKDEAVIDDRMLIIGQAASGKTVFVKRKAYLTALKSLEAVSSGDTERDINTEQVVFPVFIRLRSMIQNNRLISFEDAIASDYPLHKDLLLRTLANSPAQILLLLDGLDETSTMKKEVLDIIVSRLKIAKGLKLILTSRETGFDLEQTKVFESFIAYRVLPLERSQQIKIAEKRLDGSRDFVLQRFVDLVTNNLKLQKMIVTPLMVSLLVNTMERQYEEMLQKTNVLQVAKRDRASHVSSRHEMYSRALTTLLFDYDTKRDTGTGKASLSELWNYQQQISRFLQIFCYVLHLCRKKNFNDFMVEQDPVVKSLIHNLIMKEHNRGDFVLSQENMNEARSLLNSYLTDSIKRQKLIIISDIGHNLFQFAHLSFQEYYAGEYFAMELDEVVAKSKKDFLKLSGRYDAGFKEFFERKDPLDETQTLSLLQETWFQESLLFAASKVRFDTFEELVKYLMSLRDNETKRALHMALFMCEERSPKDKQALQSPQKKEADGIQSLKKKIEDRLAIALNTADYIYLAMHPSRYILDILAPIINKQKEDGKITLKEKEQLREKDYKSRKMLPQAFNVSNKDLGIQIAKTFDVTLQFDRDYLTFYEENAQSLDLPLYVKLQCLSMLQDDQNAAEHFITLIRTELCMKKLEAKVKNGMMKCLHTFAGSTKARKILIITLKNVELDMTDLLLIAKDYKFEFIPDIISRNGDEINLVRSTVMKIVKEWTKRLGKKEYVDNLENILGCDPEIDEQIVASLLQDDRALLHHYKGLRLVCSESLLKQIHDKIFSVLGLKDMSFIPHILNLVPYIPEPDLLQNVEYETKKFGQFKYSTIHFKITNKIIFTSEVNIDRGTFFARFSSDIIVENVMAKKNHWLKLFALYQPAICLSILVEKGPSLEQKLQLLEMMVDLGFQLNSFGWNAFKTLISDPTLKDTKTIDRFVRIFWKLVPKALLSNIALESNSNEDYYEEKQYLDLHEYIKILGIRYGDDLTRLYHEADLVSFSAYMKHLFAAKSPDEAEIMLGRYMELFESGHAPFLLDIIIDYLRSIKDLSQRARVTRQHTEDVLKRLTSTSDNKSKPFVYWESIALSRWING